MQPAGALARRVTRPTGIGATASVLEFLGRRGWITVHHPWFEQRFAVDHLVAGPGGVFAIQTISPDTVPGRWRRRLRIGAAARAAKRGARRSELGLRARGIECSVVPVVAVWTEAPRPRLPRAVLGVTVVGGSHLADWLIEQVNRQPAPDPRARRVLDVFTGYPVQAAG